MLRFCFSFFLLAHATWCVAQAFVVNVQTAFADIPSVPALFRFNNPVKAPSGGHLQGIQGWSDEKQEFIAITGSSKRFSYYLVATISKDPSSDLTLHQLLGRPYRHAGGCQLSGGYLAVGVEDNVAKDKSKVLLGNPVGGMTEVIQRQGSYKRATAGATGMTRMTNGKYLLVIGDWDSRHFDFYRSRDTSLTGFDSVFTITQPDTAHWGSYQSFNLVSDTSGQLYVIGFCRDVKGNRADLFRVREREMRLVNSRYFHCTKGSSFRYGAGLRMKGDKFLIYSCGRKLKRKNWVNVFGEAR